jgi:hypothetical protein
MINDPNYRRMSDDEFGGRRRDKFQCERPETGRYHHYLSNRQPITSSTPLTLTQTCCNNFLRKVNNYVHDRGIFSVRFAHWALQYKYSQTVNLFFSFAKARRTICFIDKVHASITPAKFRRQSSLEKDFFKSKTEQYCHLSSLSQWTCFETQMSWTRRRNQL